LCDTQKLAKIDAFTVNATAGHFEHEGLIKTKLVIIVCKTWIGLFKSLEKFKIDPLEAELQLPKIKSQNYTSLKRP
jgi:hypothetical protein